ncbi:30S ribosomal protein S2, partial [Marivirga lumbricoides]
ERKAEKDDAKMKQAEEEKKAVDTKEESKESAE